MDNIHTCRWCHKIYQGLGEHFCPECVQKMDDAFIEIRGYLDDHPQANAAEIIRETGLEERIVIQLLQDERLSEYSHGCKRCEICKKPIADGRLCEPCEKAIKEFIKKNGVYDTRRTHQRNKINGVKETPNAKAAREIRMYDE